MQNNSDYRNGILKNIFEQIQADNKCLAAWEGGSVATKTADQYSDIDLCVLADSPTENLMQKIEKSLEVYGVTHKWKVGKSPWGAGMIQTFFVLKNSPKHFFLDICIFDRAFPDLLNDFLEVERHGEPKVYFDKLNLIRKISLNKETWREKQKARLNEIKQSFVMYKILVQKELDRQNSIDAVAFYQSGLLRPLIEVLGLLHRPYRFDFGMRYLHRDFPEKDRKFIQELCYVSRAEELKQNILKIENRLYEAILQFEEKN